ncbi:HFL018Cp [Eremothecium sinecaudum]|uniref:1,3-beta-glucanosyltransferase n=1 Tax=Eremothecium sinecaudum TaxID=45286 RepID=A0A109V002_9SACH|nr:HFL018Cp [Eremothecium sinecaudum]AMD21838.1 HFL018Cp [Eremothecium sinecaudum]
MKVHNILRQAFVISAGVSAALNKTTPVSTSSGLPVIEVFGNKFFESETGEQFFIKGIAYQPSNAPQEHDTGAPSDTKYIDPLAEVEICKRDLPYLKKLGVNTIRVYSIDPTKSHDICMEEFAKNGIYVLIDLSEPDVSIIRETPSWDVKVFQRYKDVVDSMQKFDNVLGFFAGNEVTNDRTNTHASPFVKAAIRDVKNYIKQMGYRDLPVGYSTNDDQETRDNLANYFVCGNVTADFYGINMYEWCGHSSYGTSGYRERTNEFRNFPVPVFFSEFGCNAVRPRPFTEVQALYGPLMTPVWSGGLAYMYFEEDNEYGVVKVTRDNQVLELPDFKNLQKEYEKASPKGVKRKDYERTFKETVRDCPKRSEIWHAADELPPTPDTRKCGCLEQSLPCLSLYLQDPMSYKNYFEYVCGFVNCMDINGDGRTGVYGEYSDCDTRHKLSLQLSKLYIRRKITKNECPIASNDFFFNAKSIAVTQQCQVVMEDVKRQAMKKLVEVPMKQQAGKENDAGSSTLQRLQTALTALLPILALFFHLEFT